MAGLIPSFASGSTLVIQVGKTRVAYATNLTFVDDVTHAPIGGIGSYSYDSLEPTQYLARGSFTMQRYSKPAYDANVSTDTNKGNQNPARSSVSAGVPDGNSMLWGSQFNPSGLLLGKTFDILVYEKSTNGTYMDDPLFTIKDCRLTGYSISFTPGQTVSENLNFMAILIQDNIVTRDTSTDLPSANQVTL
jgi:hypothetical protein